MALVGRFDMSKATRIAYEAHPDWFVHNAKGQPLEYNGTYQACVNGGWYQDYAFRIIEEALGKYDVDGLFFNMFGYTNFTYSGDYFGNCTCENCRTRFREMYGRELPLKEDFSDPAYVDYLAFKERTTQDLRTRIVDRIAALKPGIGTTGHRGKSNLIRMEVQRSVRRPQPEWQYQAGEQAKWARAYAPDKTASSTSTNFVDFPWRFHSESAGYHLLRFAQQLANGATLDLYLLGVLDQDDKRPLEAVSDLFHWHAANQDHYRNLVSGAQIGLYNSRKSAGFSARTQSNYTEAFRGAYRALVEARLPFDFILDERVETESGVAQLERYDAVVLAGTACLSDVEARAIDAYVAAGGLVLATADTGLFDAVGNKRSAQALDCLPYAGVPSVRPDMRGAYFQIGEDESDLPDSRLVMIDGAYFHATAKGDGVAAMFKLLPPQRFGPPELCFPECESNWPGALVGDYGSGKAIYMPWSPERLYFRNSLPSHRTLIVNLLERHIGTPPVVLRGRGAVEVTIQHQVETRRTLVHLVNYSGQQNNLYEDAPDIHGLRLGVRGVGQEAKALVDGRTVTAANADPDSEGYVWFDLPPIGSFEALSLDMRP